MQAIIRIFSFPIIVFVGYIILAFGLEIYAVYPWFDIPFHITGGVSIAYAAYQYLAYLRNRFTKKRLPAIHTWILIVMCVAAIAVLWELYEYILQFFFPPEEPMTLADTMYDVLVGITGGAVSGAFFIYYKT